MIFRIKLRSFAALGIATLLFFVASGTIFGQSSAKPPKTIFRNSDGNLITNNEFVDMRMANANYPDATLVHTLEDGTVEFRLQKIPQEGEVARPFSVRAINGQNIDLSELKGKVVVLNFWFIGCPACMSEIPKLNVLREKFSPNEDIVFVAMTADSEHAVKSFLSQEKFDYDVVADAKPALDSFGFSGYPKNIVIGRDGRIVYWRSLIRAWDKFESVIREEIAK